MLQVTIVVLLINLFLCEVKNVPVDFERAHGYGELHMVELRMAGVSFVVGLERTLTNNAFCTSFKNGWSEFCTTNHLKVGDTYFFTVIRECTWSIDDDEEWEEQHTELEAMLKVEVRTTNGGWRR